jgi:hypothetical protein
MASIIVGCAVHHSWYLHDVLRNSLQKGPWESICRVIKVGTLLSFKITLDDGCG